MGLCAGFLMPHAPMLLKEINQNENLYCKKSVKGMKKVAKSIKKLAPDTIVLITPHGPRFADGVALYDNDILSGHLKDFGAESFHFEKKLDNDLADELMFSCLEISFPLVEWNCEMAVQFGGTTELDYGALVPLFFIEEEYKDYKLLCLSCGDLSVPKLYELGRLIQDSAKREGRRIVVIASGDLSHAPHGYGETEYKGSFCKIDEQFLLGIEDERILETLFYSPKLSKKSGMCAKIPLDILMGSLDGFGFRSEILSYEFPFAVGYAVVAFTELELCPQREILDKVWKRYKEDHAKKKAGEDGYIRLAREAIEVIVRDKKRMNMPSILPKEMLEKRKGVFVSLYGDCGLRGCMGTIFGVRKNIAEEIIENAIRAATKDPRYPQVEDIEIDNIDIIVDIIDNVKNLQGPYNKDPHTYGLIASDDKCSGVLLPDIEGIDTPQEQLRQVLQKAGFTRKSEYTLKTFTVERHCVSLL